VPDFFDEGAVLHGFDGSYGRSDGSVCGRLLLS
jgi:hypothetical protein